MIGTRIVLEICYYCLIILFEFCFTDKNREIERLIRKNTFKQHCNGFHHDNYLFVYVCFQNIFVQSEKRELIRITQNVLAANI